MYITLNGLTNISVTGITINAEMKPKVNDVMNINRVEYFLD